MPLGINGYNDTFRAFTDFAKVMTEGKGKPLTARRMPRLRADFSMCNFFAFHVYTNR